MSQPTTVRFPQGALDSYALRVNVTSYDTTIDLTDATAATFDVRYSDGSTTSWDATISDATTSTCMLTHTFVDGDIPDVETVIATGRIEGFGSYALVCTPVNIEVYDIYTGVSKPLPRQGI